MDKDTMEELRESELGTREYWDNRYKEEISNFKDHGDPGEVWFGEDTVERIIKWIKKQGSITNQSSFLDVGCGNGMFLVELADQGYTNLHGIDYSEDAVILARSIAEERNLKIEYTSCNILDGLKGQYRGQYDIIHDKGTYDAISLGPNIRENRIKYLENIHGCLKEDGYFIITSCNWTKDEMNKQFADYFSCMDCVPTPQFTFGGKTGNTVTSLIYKKCER